MNLTLLALFALVIPFYSNLVVCGNDSDDEEKRPKRNVQIYSCKVSGNGNHSAVRTHESREPSSYRTWVLFPEKPKPIEVLLEEWKANLPKEREDKLRKTLESFNN